MRVISWNAKIWSIIRGRNWDYGQNKFLRSKKCNDECKYLYKITFLINWLEILAKNVMYNIVAILVKKKIPFRVEIWYLFQRQMAILFVGSSTLVLMITMTFKKILGNLSRRKMFLLIFIKWKNRFRLKNIITFVL